MKTIFARKAYLEGVWEQNIRLHIDNGLITSIDRNTAYCNGDTMTSIVVPGICNAHSHAFQRALSGHVEYRSVSDKKDDFWTWRESMYRLTSKLDAKSLADIATQAYVEMVASGYTSVIEFHYLHCKKDHDDMSIAMFEALLKAANDSGIRLIYVPILYERAGFKDEKLSVHQQRFSLSLSQFFDHYNFVKKNISWPHSLGIGAHSLRAVTHESLREIEVVSNKDQIPLHIHVAEQEMEVKECIDVYNTTPVNWLLDNFDINRQWCFIHAIHMNSKELTKLAKSGATVCLCPSTEANLGDGLFSLQSYLEKGGHIAIGSDSNISINPFEELRWLEYGQRLFSRKRNIATKSNHGSGNTLFDYTSLGGSLASGNNLIGRLGEGSVADLIVMDDASPMFSGHHTDTLFDALIFSGVNLPIQNVMVNGEWHVTDGKHSVFDLARHNYAKQVAHLFNLVN